MVTLTDLQLLPPADAPVVAGATFASDALATLGCAGFYEPWQQGMTMADDDFQLWVGRIGKDRPFRHQVRKALNQSGGAIRRSRTRARSFCSRIGRGSATGRILGTSNRHSGPRSRRVVVKARLVRLGGTRTDAAAAHLRYLQRGAR